MIYYTLKYCAHVGYFTSLRIIIQPNKKQNNVKYVIWLKYTLFYSFTGKKVKIVSLVLKLFHLKVSKFPTQLNRKLTRINRSVEKEI